MAVQIRTNAAMTALDKRKGESIMKLMERIKKAKENKKGFTLVELIVVLVILAILAAILIPTLTGYIDKANEKKVIAEARMTLMAAQTTMSEYYGTEITDAVKEEIIKQVDKLAELESGATYSFDYDTSCKITKLTYSNTNYTVVYENGAWGDVSKTSGTTVSQGSISK